MEVRGKGRGVEIRGKGRGVEMRGKEIGEGEKVYHVLQSSGKESPG